MKKVLSASLIFLSLICQVSAQTNPLSEESISWKKESSGIQSCAVACNLDGQPRFISAVRFKASKFKLSVINDPAQEADSTSAMALRHGALAAVNGSYFNVKKLTPTTYVKEKGVSEGQSSEKESYRVDALLAAKGHKVEIFHCSADECEKAAGQYKYAVASGPLLLKDGAPAKEEWPEKTFFSKDHPRTIVGKNADGWIYLIVIDGRFPGKAIGASTEMSVKICRMFGLKDAINLDGGGSSTLWTAESGILSHPYDNHRFDNYGQRIVPNIIAVTR